MDKNLGKVYIKNPKKIPYRKLVIYKSNNNSNQKNENIKNVISEKISPINKYKDLQIKEKIYKNYIFNTNPSSSNKNAKSEKNSNQIIKKVTPFKNEVEQKKSIRQKRLINNKNRREDHSMILNNRLFNSIDNSFDNTPIYRKRNIIKKDLSQSPILYQYKKPLYQRRNSYTKFNSKQPDNYDINQVIKNKKNLNIEIHKPPILTNYDQNIPEYNDNEYFNNNNINNNNYNKNIKKYLMPYKTSNNFQNNKRNFINQNNNNMDLSSDNINYHHYNSRRINNNKNNNAYNNYIQNNYEENTFYKRNNNYYSLDNYQYRQQRFKNQSSRLINPIKKNIKSRILINNNDEYEDYDYDNNNEDNNYVDNNNNNDYNNDYNDYYNNNNYEDYNNEDNYYNDYDNENNINKRNNSISINVEDLMVLEEKLSEILYFLKGKNEVKNQCFDFWNYFYNSSIYKKIEKAFKSVKDIEVTRISINHELLSIMLCYEFSFDKKILNKTYILLLEILELNHRNLMIICENILNRISVENKNNIWVLKLSEIVQNSKQDEDKYNQSETYSEKITFNTDKIIKKIRNILFNYKTEYSPLIMSLTKKITQKDYEEINDFFREYILRNENVINPKNISKFRNKSEFISVQPPFIFSPRIKPYTLVLGLDETLIYFQQINKNQGVLKLRPFLIEFLENVSQYYELILFTSQSQLYAEPIINAIEQKKKYFDFIFYRENCVIVGNDYVKDLARIGRPLDSTIIVDNVPQYYRFQKENGINIKSFWAQDPRDRALYDLIPILINIAEEELDVRDSLAKYREEIVRKISSNISMNYI